MRCSASASQARGDRVALLAYNCIEWLEIYAALARAGLVAVPVNFRLVGPEIAYIVQHSEARAIVCCRTRCDRWSTADPRRAAARPGGGMSTSAPPRRRAGAGYEALIDARWRQRRRRGGPKTCSR